MLRVFEAFAGIGSYSIALQKSGYDIELVGISEVDRWAIHSYSAIHGKELIDDNKSIEEKLNYLKQRNIGYDFTNLRFDIKENDYKEINKLYNESITYNNLGDLTLIDVNEIPDLDLFAYAAPCRDISLLGKKQGFKKDSGTKSSLLWHCYRIIEGKKPKYCIMENVASMVNETNIKDFQVWLKELEELGYNNYYRVVNSKYFDVPQNRERIILVSILKEIDEHKFHLNIGNLYETTCFEDIMEKDVDSKYYLPLSKIQSISNWKSFQKPFERVIGKKSICPTITARGAGEEHSGMILFSEYLNYNTNLQNVAQNITQIDYDKYKFRFITPLECWRLQGLDDEMYYKSKENGLVDRYLYERPGRAITIPMLQEVFEKLFGEKYRVQKLKPKEHKKPTNNGVGKGGQINIFADFDIL